MTVDTKAANQLLQTMRGQVEHLRIVNEAGELAKQAAAALRKDDNWQLKACLVSFERLAESRPLENRGQILANVRSKFRSLTAIQRALSGGTVEHRDIPPEFARTAEEAGQRFGVNYSVKALR